MAKMQELRAKILDVEVEKHTKVKGLKGAKHEIVHLKGGQDLNLEDELTNQTKLKDRPATEQKRWNCSKTTQEKPVKRSFSAQASARVMFHGLN